MEQDRHLGSKGPPVGAVGYGAMGLEGYYGLTDEDNAIDVIRHALDIGCSLIDTADAYGNGHNEQVRRAHKVHPIAAVQYEYSLWRREVETEMLPPLRELGIALVPWSPLGGGFLTGTIDDLAVDDFRNNNPLYLAIGHLTRVSFLQRLVFSN